MTTFLEIKRKHPLAECEVCPLINSPCAPSIGPEDAKIAVVSRSPGFYEAQKGQPFSGPSGKVLDHLLQQNGVKREEAFLTNVVLCTTTAPPKAAIQACAPRLRSEISQADVIIAAGSEAAKEVLGVNSLSGNRGFRHRRTTDSGKWQDVVATNNPAIVLKDDTIFPNLVRDFRLAINPLPPVELPEVSWTNATMEARRIARDISRRLSTSPGTIAVDIETKGLAHTAVIVSLGLSITGLRAFAFGAECFKDDSFLVDFIRPILTQAGTTYIWHNGKFDVRNFRSKRIAGRVDEDTLLLSYALDERSDEEQVHSLDYLCMNELNWPHYEPKIVKNWKAAVARLERNAEFERLAQLEVPDELYEYNANDAAGTALLFPILKQRAIDDGVYDYYKNYLLPDSNALIDVELRGMNYNIHKAADMNEMEVLPKLDELRETLRLIVGDGSYNPASAKQNSILVYDKWKVIHDIDRGEDKERSVDKPVYTELRAGRFYMGAGHQGDAETVRRWAGYFTEFKELDKQRGTYVEGLIKRAEFAGGKVFSDFKLHSTVTGRSSSSRPNLQNVTRTKENLPNIRSLFVPSEGCCILSADYSQAELRAIATLSGDTRLQDIYRDKRSLHREVAERFYGKDYNYEQYVHAKNMDFGVAYGQSAETFQEKHDIPVAEGKDFIKWWFSNFPGVARWRKEVARTVKRDGYIQTPFGHKRRFYLITFENKGAVYREAINCIPQNIAARLTLYSVRRLVDLGLPVVNTVHDSIVLDCPIHRVGEFVEAIKGVMESAPKVIGWIDIPFEVEFSVGENWGELKEIESV